MPGKPWPRVWWVPGGLLSLLPIHAAGHHTNPPDPGRRTVLDWVISSYTPTVGALAHARAHTPPRHPANAIQSLIVAMPATPDLPREGRTGVRPAEAAWPAGPPPHPTVLTELRRPTTPQGQLPTKDAVLAHLPGCAIAHFACHGYTDPADPSQSRLLLHDHRHDPLTIAALAHLALDHAQLAYLSACGTARAVDGRLLDEAIHLTAAFQLAGLPPRDWHPLGKSAITLLSRSPRPSTHHWRTRRYPRPPAPGAAQALHQATLVQRDQDPTNPYRWASYIHAGA